MAEATTATQELAQQQAQEKEEKHELAKIVDVIITEPEI